VRVEAGDDVTPGFSLAQQRALCYRKLYGVENQSAAARFAGVTRVTLYRWLQQDEFKDAWNDQDNWHDREIRVRRLSSELSALDVLQTVLTDDGAKNSDKIAAAKTLLGYNQRNREFEEGPAAGALSELMRVWLDEGMQKYGRRIPGVAVLELEAGRPIDT
jgi:hypothetical protein